MRVLVMMRKWEEVINLEGDLSKIGWTLAGIDIPG